jgi:hypothetical protein
MHGLCTVYAKTLFLVIMVTEGKQDDDLIDFNHFSSSDDVDVEEGNILYVNESAISHYETVEEPTTICSLVNAESPVVNISSHPIDAKKQVSISRVAEEQEHFPLPNT